jgi:hypothetical protein
MEDFPYPSEKERRRTAHDRAEPVVADIRRHFARRAIPSPGVKRNSRFVSVSLEHPKQEAWLSIVVNGAGFSPPTPSGTGLL